MSLFMKLVSIAVCFCPTGAFAEDRDYDQILKPYLNQKLILRALGDEKDVSIKAGNLRHPMGSCDVAVEVLDVHVEKKKAVILLEQIGHIRTGGKSYCTNVWPEMSFTITDMNKSTPEKLAADLQDILLTPEAYLARNGYSKSPDQSPAQGPMKMPKIILEITPTTTEEARQNFVRNKSAANRVAVSVTIGADGKIHSSSIARDPGFGLGKQSLRVLPLWRFEPARMGNTPIDTASVMLEFTFSIY
jgi:hypothetical protein